MPIALRFPVFELVKDFLIHYRFIRPVNLFTDGLHLVCQGHVICIDRGKIGQFCPDLCR